MTMLIIAFFVILLAVCLIAASTALPRLLRRREPDVVVEADSRTEFGEEAEERPIGDPR
ncbi:hypothetical protein [Rhizosaccharibacter radicis]|uniref:Uncharacterized protein n=1 Tax=Rhizosaccharibacter radicis TaxID=2782605 RepID=A0ABT1VXW4_9PROT|nr:hypothetical protein [Acetobacteraceae bacterium KSS12]